LRDQIQRNYYHVPIGKKKSLRDRVAQAADDLSEEIQAEEKKLWKEGKKL
jgi:hypothetical protein